MNRAIFYVSRMISAQKEREFTGSEYNKIKRVYSIWICMGMKDNTLSHICLTEKQLIGVHRWKGKLDLLNIVMIGLSDELPENNEIYELHRLLGTLLSKELEVTEKLSIIETEYQIPVETEAGKDVEFMCNLSQGIKETGIQLGKAEQAHCIALKLFKTGMPMEQIADILETGKEEIRGWLSEITSSECESE